MRRNISVARQRHQVRDSSDDDNDGACAGAETGAGAARASAAVTDRDGAAAASIAAWRLGARVNLMFGCGGGAKIRLQTTRALSLLHSSGCSRSAADRLEHITAIRTRHQKVDLFGAFAHESICEKPDTCPLARSIPAHAGGWHAGTVVALLRPPPRVRVRLDASTACPVAEEYDRRVSRTKPPFPLFGGSREMSKHLYPIPR